MEQSANTTVTNPYYTYTMLLLSPNFRNWEASKGEQYASYRQAWLERPRQLDHGELPLNLNLEVTTRCNLACTFCTQPSLTKDQIGDLSWELIAKALDESEPFGLPAVNLNGLGEPMLRRDLAEIIKYAKDRKAIDVMFHTNATIMTDRYAKELIEAGLDRIIFSVDSPDKETYESMRINARYDRVVRNVHRFVQIRNEMARTVPIVRMTMVVTERTVKQVDDFVRKWHPVADMITLQDLTWRIKLLDNGQWENRERSAVPIDLNEVAKEAQRRKMGFVCPYLYQSTYVFWDGTIIPCSNPDARKHMIMGDLSKQSLHEIWHGRTYRELRELHASGRWYEHPICRRCEVPLVELFKTMTGQSTLTMKDSVLDLSKGLPLSPQASGVRVSIPENTTDEGGVPQYVEKATRRLEWHELTRPPRWMSTFGVA